MSESPPNAWIHVPSEELQSFAAPLFVAAGLDAEKAASVARLLILTDMMGRPTHGLAQCEAYLDEIEHGQMTCAGEPEVVRDGGGTVVWDGGYRPGLWLVDRAIALGIERVRAHGVFTCAIRRSHHIGCLAALAKSATDRGLFVTLASSGPHSKIVAPYGGKRPLFSPNPFAIGFPASRHPVLVDICASITTVSMTREKVAAGTLFEHPWLMDSEGRPTRDPKVMEETAERGSLLLLGGYEAGHKGFGLALMVEALTQGLGGFGRRDAPTRWGAGVYLQLIDLAAFAGRESFIAQMDFLAEECRANPPLDPARPVRLPGEQATRNIEKARVEGVPLSASTVAALVKRAQRLGVDTSILSERALPDRQCAVG
jgi:LDH2 family malate/lactate/ureidoglycolate dehydrogenase